MKADRDTFGPRLRLERERRGITLKHIADSTKIKESQFAELERGDFSKWPQGIFRRAHLCAYVSAIGLPAQPVLAEFLRLFPEESAVDQTEPPKANAPADGPQTARAVIPTRRPSGLADRVWIVAFDLASICLISSAVAAVAGMNFWFVLGLVGLGYTAVGSACFAQSVGGKVLHRIQEIVQDSLPKPPAAALSEVRLVPSRPDRVASAGSGTAASDMHEEHEVHERRASA
jgi:transcriptional regulator with XRE-family HTH domain